MNIFYNLDFYARTASALIYDYQLTPVIILYTSNVKVRFYIITQSKRVSIEKNKAILSAVKQIFVRSWGSTFVENVLKLKKTYF